jgi:hypothetical protein
MFCGYASLLCSPDHYIKTILIILSLKLEYFSNKKIQLIENTKSYQSYIHIQGIEIF